VSKLEVYTKLERVKLFIKFFIEKYTPCCCFCEHYMKWEVFFPKFSGLDRDDWTIHHLDHNRKNDNIINKILCHRECHRRHHRLEQIFKKNNPTKKFKYVVYIPELPTEHKTFKV